MGKISFSEVWRPVFARVGTCVCVTGDDDLEMVGERVPVCGSEIL